MVVDLKSELMSQEKKTKQYRKKIVKTRNKLNSESEILKEKLAKAKEQDLSESDSLEPTEDNNEDGVLKEDPFANLSEDEIVSQLDEEKKQWETRLSDYFERGLGLTNTDYNYYQDKSRELEKLRGEIMNKYAQAAEANNLPYIPSFQEEQEMYKMQLKFVKDLESKMGKKNVDRLIEYEREMKVKMIVEKGYYNSFGVF